LDYIDLRSDTVTIPTPAMRTAMANADVGDDVYEEDPTINHLQELAASKMNKEAGLFVPSGTMGNLVSILTHCNRGDEVILGNKSHTFLFEAGGISALGGIHSCQIQNQSDGMLLIEDIRSCIHSDDLHYTKSRLIVLENTHNRCGGTPLTPEYTRLVGNLAHENGLLLHVDGARIFNAAVALGVCVSELAAPADSVVFCVSKGLCAPVGSLICGSKKFISKARRVRKQLGGGMRQAGVLAAAAIVSLDTMVDRLAEDHRRAKVLAEGLATLPRIALNPLMPPTNMIFFTLSDDTSLTAQEFVYKLRERKILVRITEANRFRLLTHYYINDDAVAYTIEMFRSILTTN